MARVITVKNYKGGVGKTTVSDHVAGGLAAMGYRVGLMDTDSSGDASMMLNMPEENGLFNLLIEDAALDSVVREVPPEHYATSNHYSGGSLLLIPSSSKTRGIPNLLKDEPEGVFRFVAMTDRFAEAYALDVIVVDTNPSMSDADTILNMATDYYLYVTECTRLSYSGLTKALHSFQVFGEQRRRFMNRASSVLGIVPNKMQQQTVLHRRNIEALGKKFGTDLVWPPIIAGIEWQNAADAKQLIYTWSPNGQEAHLAWDMVNRVIRELEREQTAR